MLFITRRWVNGISLACLAALLGGGCASVMERLDLLNCRYALGKVTPRVDLSIPVNHSAVVVDLEVTVTNPNPSQVTLDHLVFDLLVNETKVASGDSRQQKSIEANSEGMIEVQSRFTYEELKETFLALAKSMQRGEAKYELRGTAFYDTVLGPLQFPVTIKKEEVGK